MMNDEARELFEGLKANKETGRANDKWPFSTMEIDQFEKYDNQSQFLKAKNAAYQIQNRKGWQFVMKWDRIKNIGIIGRIA